MPSQSSPKQRKLKTISQVRSLLASVCRELEQGKMDPRRATAIANVARVLVDCIRDGDLEGKISELEALYASNLVKENTVAPSPNAPN